MEITLRQARRMKDLSMREMADKIGVCEATYRKFERNPETVSIDTAKAICGILGVTVEQIFFGSNLSFTHVRREAAI